MSVYFQTLRQYDQKMRIGREHVDMDIAIALAGVIFPPEKVSIPPYNYKFMVRSKPVFVDLLTCYCPSTLSLRSISFLCWSTKLGLFTLFAYNSRSQLSSYISKSQ